KSWQKAIDKGVDRGIEESVVCRAKEYADAIASGTPDKDYKLFQVFMAVILAAHNKGHITVVMKLAKLFMKAINNGSKNLLENLLEKEIRKIQEVFKAAVQGPGDEDTTQRFLKLTTAFILAAKEEGFSDL